MLDKEEQIVHQLSYQQNKVMLEIEIYRHSLLDRVPKKLKFSEWPAEFIVYSRDKYKNFLLTKFSKILQNARAHQQLM